MFLFPPKNLQKSVYDFLLNFVKQDSSRLIFPAFNYTYGDNLEFNILEDDIEVGSLPVWVKKTQNFHRTPIPFYSVLSIDNLGIDGNHIESQAFAYLAIRSYLKLPISFPETTGCKKPCTGGILVKNY